MQRAVRSLASVTALAGGLVLLAIILLTSVSIIGRSINKLMHSGFFSETLPGLSQWVLSTGVGEINGNYELLEAGMAFAIFAFLPICQLYGSHATVDVFTSILSRRANRWIVLFWEILLFLAIVLIVWQLEGGMQRYIRNGQTTLFLQFPVWWSYAASFAAGVVACIVAAACVVNRLREAIANRDFLPSEHAEH